MEIIFKHDDWEYDRENLEYLNFDEHVIPNVEHFLTVSDIVNALDPFEYYANGCGDIGYSSFED